MAVMVNDPDQAQAILFIMEEIKRSERDHPVYPTDPLRRTAIMCEEAGEALKAAVDLTRPNISPIPEAIHDFKSKLFCETIQTGAMAVKLICAMLREKEGKRA